MLFTRFLRVALRRRGVAMLCAWPVALAALMPPAAGAAEIGFSNVQYYRTTHGVNRFHGPTDELFFAIDATPSAKGDPVVGANTVVTASQGAVSVRLEQSLTPFIIDGYFATLPYDPALTGEWTFSIRNDHPSITNSPAKVMTSLVGNQQPIPPVQSMSLRGSLDTGLTISWSSPPGADSTQVDIFTLPVNGPSVIIHSAYLPRGVSSYTIPDILASGLTLERGATYMVDVINEKRRGDGSLLVTSASYFEFTPTTQSINAFLPTVDAAGVYRFNVVVDSADEFIAIDPLVAIGYDYATGAGDPDIAEVVLPMVGDNRYELFLFDGVTWVFDREVEGGTPFSFSVGGVDRFRIMGIEPAAGLDPADPTAFVTQLRFTAAGQFTGTMTPLAIDLPVPAPAGLPLVGIALVALAATRRRRAALN